MITVNEKGLYSARYGKSEIFIIERHLRQVRSYLYITFRDSFEIPIKRVVVFVLIQFFDIYIVSLVKVVYRIR